MERSMTRFGLVMILALFSWGIGASQATPPQFQIIIESASPYYLPASAKVPIGASIRWDNPTGSPHTITQDGCEEEASCMFDSGEVLPGGSYVIPGLPPGRYPYHCRLHPIMRAVLTVVEPSATSSET
ncbi:MAG: cupredoxin domain-containing protein [Nitrospiraceae bacterium]